MKLPTIYQGHVPQYVLYTEQKGSVYGGRPKNFYRASEFMTEAEAIDSFKKRREAYERGEFVLFELSPVRFHTDVTIKRS